MKIIEMFDPRREDGRLNYFLKTISISAIFGIIGAPFIIFEDKIQKEFMMIFLIIVGFLYTIFQSLIAIRRIRNLGGNLISNMIFYNLYQIISIIGFVLILLGIEGNLTILMAYGGGGLYLSRISLDIIYSTIKKDKKDFYLLNPKGKDGRLEFLLKSFFVFFITIPLFGFFIIPFAGDLKNQEQTGFTYIYIGMFIWFILFQLLQSLNVVRRVRDIGGNIKKHLISYNIWLPLVGIGVLNLYIGNKGLGVFFFTMGGGFNLVRYVLDIVYLLRKGKKECDINDKEEKAGNNEIEENNTDESDEVIDDEEMDIPEWILLIMIIGVMVIGAIYFLIMK